MKHLAKKCGVPEERMPLVLERFGNSGGASVPLALTQGVPESQRTGFRFMTVGYGVGLSWGASITRIDADIPRMHISYSGAVARA